MKLHLTTLALLLLCLGASAQNHLTIEKGPLITEDVHSVSVQAFCKKSEKELLVFKQVQLKKKSDTNNFYLEVFDNKLQRLSSDEIARPNIAGQDVTFFSVFPVKNYFQTFWVALDKSAEKAYLLTARVEDNGRLGTVSQINMFDDLKDFSWKKWGIYPTADTLGWMVERVLIDPKSEVRRSTFEMFDHNFKQLWSQPVAHNIKADKVYTSQHSMARTDAVVSLLQFDLEKKSQSPASYQQAVWIARGAGQPGLINIDPPPGFILLRCHFRVSGNTAEAYGTYTSRDNKKYFFEYGTANAQGTFYLKINLETSRLEDSRFTPFPESVFKFFRIKEKDRDNGVSALYLKQVKRNDTGGNPWLFFENSYSPSYLSGNKYHESITTASAVLLPYVDGKAGTPLFIPKGMHSDDNWTGHGTGIVSTGGTIHCLYNDSPKNRGEKLETDQDAYAGESPGSTLKGRKKEVDVMCTSILPDGQLKTQKLFNSDDDDIYLTHTFAFPYNANSFIIVVGMNEQYQLVRVRMRE